MKNEKLVNKVQHERVVSHRTLVDEGALWLNKKAPNIYHRSQFVLTEFNCHGTNERPDIFGLRPYGHILIEVKVSRADFMQDFKKRGRDPLLKQIGNRRFYLAPKGLLDIDKIPEKWGLLEWDGEIQITKDSEWFESDNEATGYIYHSVLRRLNKPQIFNFDKCG